MASHPGAVEPQPEPEANHVRAATQFSTRKAGQLDASAREAQNAPQAWSSSDNDQGRSPRIHFQATGNGRAVPVDRKAAGHSAKLNPWGGGDHPLAKVRGGLSCTVKTGLREGAGTDARVWMRLHGKDGSRSEVFELRRTNRHDFADGQLFRFDLMSEGGLPEVNVHNHLKGDVKKIEIWRDDGRDVSIDGEDPSWLLQSITVEEPFTGDHWQFQSGAWVPMTMTENALKAVEDETCPHDTAMDQIAICPAGVVLEKVMKYDTMSFRKAYGMVNVGGDETELQYWNKSGTRHFISLSTVDKWISALIIFSLLFDVMREEGVRTCVEDEQYYRMQTASNDTVTRQSCGMYDTANVAYGVMIAFDLFILVIFLAELIIRFTLKYWGMRNLYAHVLKQYNRRYRKLGIDAFKKNGIRRNDPTRSLSPWFRTLWVPENDQLQKDFEDCRKQDAQAQRRIPYNFLSQESLGLIVFELFVVALALLVQSIFVAAAGWTIDVTDNSSRGLLKATSIMRIIRVVRIVTRINKLRRLASALLEAFGGVLWIFVLVIVVSYGFAIVGVLTFMPSCNPSTDQCTDSYDVTDECDAVCVYGNLEVRWFDLKSAANTLFFNVMLGDGISDVTGETKLGPAGNWIYIYVIMYLVTCVFLLMEAITGYIVDVISTQYHGEEKLDNMKFACVARVRVVDWFHSLQPGEGSDGGGNFRNGEKAWLGKWLNERIENKNLNIVSVEHIRRMLLKVQKYDLSYAQMEYEAEPGSSNYHPSDWLIGVRSEAEMTRLMEHGFTYIDEDEEDAPKNPDAVDEFNREDGDGPLKLAIPVSREREGELISITKLRTPNFASEDDVHSAFEPYGVVTKVEREHWDLPEDEAHSDLVAQLEQTNTMTWHVQLYKNELAFDVLPLDQFAEAPRKQLEWRKLLDCPAVEIYGQMCPILPKGIVGSHSRQKSRHEDDTGLKTVLQRFTLSELFVFAKEFADTADTEVGAALGTALDSLMPKEAVINHLIQPLSVLNMLMHHGPLPDQPDNAQGEDSIMNPASAPRQQYSNMTLDDVLKRVKHCKAQGYITDAEYREMDTADNPKERCIDLLLQVLLKNPRMLDQSAHNDGVAWKSRWDELTTCLANLKMSLYITTARLREMTVTHLKERAVRDAGVRPATLDAAIAFEMWQRCESDGCDKLVREALGKDFIDHHHKMDRYFFPSGDAPTPRADQTTGVGHSKHTRVFKAEFSKEDKALHNTLIGIVTRRKDILQEAEVTASRREGAIKSILLKFDLGGSSAAALDQELEILHRPQLHSKTIENFKISDLYRIAQNEHLDRKWTNFWDDSLFGAPKGSDGRTGRKPLIEGQGKNQLAAALDSDDPRKTLIWRLLEATSRPAPLTDGERDEKEKKAEKAREQKRLKGLGTTKQALSAFTSGAVNSSRERSRSPTPPEGDSAALVMSQSLTTVAPASRPSGGLAVPRDLPEWAEKMLHDMEKVRERSDKLCHHTEKLGEKVDRMQSTLVEQLALENSEPELESS